jgi:hypothetical protein
LIDINLEVINSIFERFVGVDHQKIKAEKLQPEVPQSRNSYSNLNRQSAVNSIREGSIIKGDVDLFNTRSSIKVAMDLFKRKSLASSGNVMQVKF